MGVSSPSQDNNRKRPPREATPSLGDDVDGVGAPSNKKAKWTSNDAPAMSSLDDDTLRAILVRTCASDHAALRQTCKRFCSTLNSFACRQERGLLGYAEVEGVQIREPFEQYKRLWSEPDWDGVLRTCSETDQEFIEEYDELGNIGEYGNHDLCSINFKVMVDGQELEMEGIRVHLVPRCSPFFEMCDISGDLSTLGTTCFNNRGKLRLTSLKTVAATANHGRKDHRPLLYISRFELPKEYRNLACPVGPILLQSLLNEALKDQWSIAMYNPCDSAQFTEQDKALSYQMPDILRRTPLSEEDEQKKKEWYKRLDELAMQDMRQFFRAGFHQVTDEEVVENSNDIVYALPSDLPKPKLSTEAEALQVKIERPSKGPPPQTEEELKFFSLMRGKSWDRQDKVKAIDEWKLPIRENPTCRPHMEMLDEQLQQLRDSIQALERSKHALEEQRAALVLGLDGLSTVAQQLVLNPVYKRLKEDPLYNYPGTTQQQSLTIEDLFAPALEFHNNKREECRGKIAETEALVVDLEENYPGRVAGVVAQHKQRLREYDSATRLRLKEFLDIAEASTEELILKSNAIHACTKHMARLYVQFLLELLPSDEKKTQALNEPDGEGLTPLMVAASSRSLSDSEEPKRNEMCKFLIKHGADKDVTTRRGLTALGVFRQARRNENDFALTMGFRTNPLFMAQYEAKDRLGVELESILMPTSGPTSADDAILDDDESDSEPEDNFDEEDEEDDFEDEEEEEAAEVVDG